MEKQFNPGWLHLASQFVPLSWVKHHCLEIIFKSLNLLGFVGICLISPMPVAANVETVVADPESISGFEL